VNVAASAAPPPTTAAPGESCPLCGAPLRPEQDWCLRCGGAARTRLAASPNWKAPTAAVALLVALCLGVLAAALVKLAGETGPAPTRTATVTTTAAAAVPPATTPPATTASTPTTSTTLPTTTGALGTGGTSAPRRTSSSGSLANPLGLTPGSRARKHLEELTHKK